MHVEMAVFFLHFSESAEKLCSTLQSKLDKFNICMAECEDFKELLEFENGLMDIYPVFIICVPLHWIKSFIIYTAAYYKMFFFFLLSLSAMFPGVWQCTLYCMLDKYTKSMER